MTLKYANVGVEYTIKSVYTDDEELKKFLFSLGCYEGEQITIIRKLRGSLIVAIKDARYDIDNNLADAIEI